MAAFLIPPLKYRGVDSNGDALNGGKLYTYVAGTSTPKATYSDYENTANTNPVILDANGEADVFIETGYYKFVLKDANDVTIATQDRIGLPSNTDASVPSGGTADYMLAKVTGDDYNYAWVVNNPAPAITGTRAAPSSIVAGTGIAFTGTRYKNIWFIQGSGGAVTVSANPQIAAGTNVGQKLKTIGRHDTNTVTLSDGNGLYTGGLTLQLGANSIVDWFWDGSAWVLDSTNGLI